MEQPTITISLHIVNTYPVKRLSLERRTVVTTVTDAVIPAPPPETDESAWDEWVREQIRERVGTGTDDAIHVSSWDAWHDVKVTACSDPALVGRVFEFGY